MLPDLWPNIIPGMAKAIMAILAHELFLHKKLAKRRLMPRVRMVSLLFLVCVLFDKAEIRINE